MSNPVQRYRHGNVTQLRGQIAAGNKVVIGDLVGVDGQYFSDFDTLNAGTGGYHDVHAGVLMDGGTTGNETVDTTDAVVGYGAIFEFPLDSTVDVARPVGWPVAAVGNQTVSLLSGLGDLSESIANLAKPAVVGDTTVWVLVHSVVMEGGPVAIA